MLEANASVPLTASAVNFLTFWKDQKHLLQKKSSNNKKVPWSLTKVKLTFVLIGDERVVEITTYTKVKLDPSENNSPHRLCQPYV